jgi:hypothetical protein
VKGVREPVGQQRMDARPGREDLERTHVPRRGIAAPRGRDVAPHLAHHTVEPPEAEHEKSLASGALVPAPIAASALVPALAHHGAKNGVET